MHFFITALVICISCLLTYGMTESFSKQKVCLCAYISYHIFMYLWPHSRCVCGSWRTLKQAVVKEFTMPFPIFKRELFTRVCESDDVSGDN